MKPYDVRSGMDADALLYLEARKLRIAPGAVGFYLDWPAARVERARKRVAYYRAHHPLSRELSFGRTQIENRISLFFSDLGGNAEASGERFGERAISASKILTMEEFSKLQQAQESLTRFTADAQLARNTVADLKAQLNAAELAVDEDGEDSLIHGREPNRDLAKQVAKIAAALKAAEQNVRHHDGAIAKQARIIQSIEEKIFGHRHQAFEGAVSGDVKKLHRLMDEFVATSLDIRAKAAAYGFADYVPFPSPDRDGSRSEIRSLQNGLYHSAQILADRWAHSYIDCPYQAPDVQPFPVPQVPRPPADPIQVRINDLVAARAECGERYTQTCYEETQTENEVHKIRESYRTMGGFLAPFEPGDKREFERLNKILEEKREQIKALKLEHQKTSDLIYKLEQELQQKRAAALVAA